ncbi:MAG: D-alanyl-D-alanine carboxypeptidase [Clostridia bacterium]|nr:D-alanyl-D-alanine carboxypeptidase [Clostridia bacterium]
MKFKKITATILTLCLALCSFLVTVSAEPETPQSADKFGLDCRSAILMEAGTGKVLYEMNADESLPPASVTKVMTLLLVMEAIENGKISLSDTVTASAHACSMGGSQIYLKEGEQMSVEELIKSVVIASANDAALALAEYVAGTEEAFVELMNKRAEQLGLTGTHFENTNGLDDTVQNHVSTARDIAVMSRELIKHKKITEYSSIWMDTIRDGAFGLTNTNRLVRFYKGATGLKTGSTAKAKFCITATAEREGMSLICVIMAAPTRDIRNAAATSLLDWGFANYAVYRNEGKVLEPLRVLGGVSSSCEVEYPEFSCVVNKADIPNILFEVETEDTLAAPVKQGEKVGRVVYRIGETELGTTDITARESIDKIGFGGLLLRMLSKMCMR